MCAPAALGVAQAGVGIMGAIGGQSQAQAQADAQNAQITAQNKQNEINYKYRNAQQTNNWANTQEEWAAKKSQYSEQMYANRNSIGKAYGAASMANERLYRDFLGQSQSIRMQQLAASTGTGETRGKTANRLSKLPGATAGMQMAAARDNMKYAQENINFSMHEARDEYSKQNRENWRAVSIAPKPGMRAPALMQQAGVAGPGSMGMMAGIGSALLSGMSTFNSLKPPTGNPWGGPGGGGSITGNSINNFGGGNPLGNLMIGNSAPLPFTPGSF